MHRIIRVGIAVALTGFLGACDHGGTGNGNQAQTGVAVSTVPGGGVAASGVVAATGVAAGMSSRGDGAASAAWFNSPSGIATDSTGNVYVADTGNNTIRKITPAGVVTTLAGTALSRLLAGHSKLTGVATDNAGHIYVADAGDFVILSPTPSGEMTTLAGNGRWGPGDGTGLAVSFSRPWGVATDSAGNVYVADTESHTIRNVTPSGVVTTLAGTAGVRGGADGTGAAARFDTPKGVATDNAGNIYVADTGSNSIRKITPSGVVTTLADAAKISGGYADGTGKEAGFNYPSGIATDNARNVYVADTGNHTIRKITPSGVVTTLAGTAGAKGSSDGTGAAARFNSPGGVATDSAGNIYVADTDNDMIRKITPEGVVTTLAGSVRPSNRLFEFFNAEEGIYVTAPETSLYDQPSTGSTLLVTLPIGETIKANALSNCPLIERPAPPDLEKWTCVTAHLSSGGEVDEMTGEVNGIDANIQGWVLAGQVGREQPTLEALIAAYDKTPKEDKSARRKLAERAIALDPLSNEAQKRLIAVLTEMGDQPAIAAADKSFRLWQAHQPTIAQGGNRAVYSYDGPLLTSIASFENGRIVQMGLGAAAERGQFYYAYSADGHRVGTLATVWQFNCRGDASCSSWSAPVRALDFPNASVVRYATNFPVQPAPAMTVGQRSILAKIMKQEIAASPYAEEDKKKAPPEEMQRSHQAFVGRLSRDGKLFLAGQATWGFYDDPRSPGVGADFDVFHSLLVIAEQQKDGSFKKVDAPDVTKTPGQCGVSGAMDIDGDGTDEIIVVCGAKGHSDTYIILQRVGGHWERNG